MPFVRVVSCDYFTFGIYLIKNYDLRIHKQIQHALHWRSALKFSDVMCFNDVKENLKIYEVREHEFLQGRVLTPLVSCLSRFSLMFRGNSNK